MNAAEVSLKTQTIPRTRITAKKPRVVKTQKVTHTESEFSARLKNGVTGAIAGAANLGSFGTLACSRLEQGYFFNPANYDAQSIPDSDVSEPKDSQEAETAQDVHADTRPEIAQETIEEALEGVSDPHPEVADISDEVPEIDVPADIKEILDANDSCGECNPDVPVVPDTEDAADVPKDLVTDAPDGIFEVTEDGFEIKDDVCEDNCPTDVVPEDEPDAPNPFCANLPEVTLSYPEEGAIDLPVNGLTLQWSSTDLDQSDPITYQALFATDESMIQDLFTSEILTTPQFAIPDGQLSYNRSYFWMVKAFDGCSQINYSPVQRFTTEKDCQPFVITESDFVDGTLSNLDNESIPGTLILDRQWTARWRATDGTLPKDSTPKWTHDAPSGGTYELVNDPKTGKPTLHQAANDINAVNREVMEGLPIINATGSAFMIRARIERADGTDGFACAVEHYDGTKKVRLGIDETKLVETMGTNQQFIMDTTTSPHSYLVGLKGNAYEIFVDNSFAMDQGIKSVASDSNLRTRWGDTSESPEIECDMYVSAFYYYVNGNKVPYFDQGKYESKVYDLSSNNVNFAGEGANLSFNSTTPYATQVIFSTRTGDSEIPDGTWSNWEIAIQGLVQSPAARFLQIQAQIKSTDSNVSPTISDFSLSGCTYLPN